MWDCGSAPELHEEWDRDLRSADPLSFPGYVPPYGDHESVRTGLVALAERPLALIDCRIANSGGTMGVVAGERIVRALDRAVDRRLPVAMLVSSGGARLQEGMVSLTQMARTASAMLRHKSAGLQTVAVLRPHTTGGVYASWASLADLRAGQPGATIGFGGPRVVKEVTGSFPPASSHTAESAYRHGLLDALVPAEQQWDWIASALFGGGSPLVPQVLRPTAPDRSTLPSGAYDLLLRTRDPARPSGLEWAAWLCDTWTELRGPDPSVRAGLATLGKDRVVVIAMDRHAVRGASARQGADAFRLAQRAIALANRLRLPIVTLVDTPGAEPGPGAEADGIAGEIARTLMAMAGAKVPTVCLCVGEGGSGGAMALAHTDRLCMLSGAVFSVIGPEAGAAILFRDSGKAAELARNFKMAASDLASLGVADLVIDEISPDVVGRARKAIVSALAAISVGDRDHRIDRASSEYLLGDPATLVAAERDTARPQP